MMIIIAYIVKMEFNSNQKRTVGDDMLSNIESIHELVNRLRDKIINEHIQDVKDRLEFSINEINQYREELWNRYISNNKD